MSTQHKLDEQITKLTRRQAMKGLAGGAAVAGTGMSLTAPTAAQTGGFWNNLNDVVGVSIASPGLGIVSATADALGWTAGSTNENTASEIKKAGAWDVKRYYNSTVRELALNTDLLEYAPDGIFSDAKLKGIEKMNNGATASAVETAMLDLARKEISQLEENIIKAGSQGMKTLNNYAQQAVDNGVVGSVMGIPSSISGWHYKGYQGESIRTVTCIDGRSVDVAGHNYSFGDSGSTESDTVFPVSDAGSLYPPESQKYQADGVPCIVAPSGSLFTPIPVTISDSSDYDGSIPNDYYGKAADHTTIETLRDNVVSTWNNDLKPDIQTWAANAYDAYAAGSVDPKDLLSSTEVATLISDEEPANRAIAHLRASGISVKSDYPATIETTAEGGTVTVKNATLGSTGTSATLSVGETVDPSTLSYSYTVGYSSDNVAIQWPHYTEQLDGGILTVNQVPSTNITEWVGTPITMMVQTSKGETASFDPFQYGDPSNPSVSFDVDLSGQLDEPIANVTDITIFSAKSESVTATKFLENTFTVTEGDAESYSFTHDRNIQTTDNYVTAKEWEERNKELQQTIDELRSDGSGGGNLFGGIFGGGLPSLPGLGVVESAVVVGLGFFGLNALSS